MAQEKKIRQNYVITLPSDLADKHGLPISPQSSFTYSPEQALSAILVKHNKKFLYEEILIRGIGKYVKVAKEGGLEKAAKPSEIIEDGISLEAKRHELSRELAKRKYARHPEKYECPAQLNPNYEKVLRMYSESRIDKLFSQLCLGK